VYFRLTEAVKRRFIYELRRFWSYHPRYQDIVGNIQGKFSFSEQPQTAIIVKNGGGSHVSLSADNYVGVVNSYVYKALCQNYPGVFLEWVREDAKQIQDNGGRFPSPPGVYYIELTEEDQFYVDPLLSVYGEQVLQLDENTGQLSQPYLDKSLYLYEMPNGFLLQEGANYTADPTTGTITLTHPLTGGRYLVADYRYAAPSRGPFKLNPMYADKDAIPGVVLAFGRRCKKGDRVAVVVQGSRQPASLEYGGRWELTMDFDIMARDVYAQQEIHDYTVTYLWGVARNRLSSEGIEIKDISLGGESEEPYDDTGDDYFYNASFSITIETDWAVHVPLNAMMRMVAPLTLEEAGIIANQPAPTETGNIDMLESLGLQSFSDPYFVDKSHHYEVIR
jgi:hypothetical protein